MRYFLKSCFVKKVKIRGVRSLCAQGQRSMLRKNKHTRSDLRTGAAEDTDNKNYGDRGISWGGSNV